MLAQLPPPIHGSALVSQAIRDSATIGEAFDIHPIDISTAREIHEIGKISIGKVLRFLTLLLKVIGQTWLKHYDLVYVTLSPSGPAFYKDSMLALVASLGGAQQIFHLHGKGLSRTLQSPRLVKPYYRLVFRKSWVILLSKLLYDDIAELVPRTRVRFLRNAVQSQHMHLQETRNSSPPCILFLSNMIPSKGPMILLEAVKTLHDRGYEFEVRFAGRWASEPSFKSRFLGYIEQYKLGHYVSYLGPQYGEEKRRLLNTADIFVLPTYYKNECFPLAILEAMSCSLPVISTFEGAIPDIVDDGQTGYLVPQESVTELEQRLALLLADPELRKRMGCKGRQKYDMHYRIEGFERGFIEIMDSVLFLSGRDGAGEAK